MSRSRTKHGTRFRPYATPVKAAPQRRRDNVGSVPSCRRARMASTWVAVGRRFQSGHIVAKAVAENLPHFRVIHAHVRQRRVLHIGGDRHFRGFALHPCAHEIGRPGGGRLHQALRVGGVDRSGPIRCHRRGSEQTATHRDGTPRALATMEELKEERIRTQVISRTCRRPGQQPDRPRDGSSQQGLSVRGKTVGHPERRQRVKLTTPAAGNPPGP